MPFPTSGLVLYGPPASGKSSVASALGKQSGWCRYRLLKSGPSNESYRALSSQHQPIWQADKYGRTYAIDESGFADIPGGQSVVIELGEATAVEAVRRLPIEWTVAHLWCPRSTAVDRMQARGDEDISDRLTAWDNTAPVRADLVIDTSQIALAQVLDLLSLPK